MDGCKIKKRKLYRISYFFVMTIATVIVCILCSACSQTFSALMLDTYYTTDINEYGKYPALSGNSIEQNMQLFFPERIEEGFQNVVYSYKVVRSGCEVYLEFTFDTGDELEAYVKEATVGMLHKTFIFDSSYEEYIWQKPPTENRRGYIADYVKLYPQQRSENGVEYYRVDTADVNKILVNRDEKRVIYIALFNCDGGAFNANELTVFFDRFQIDIKDYEEHTKQYRKTGDGFA